jgi:hypothetical protein
MNLPIWSIPANGNRPNYSLRALVLAIDCWLTYKPCWVRREKAVIRPLGLSPDFADPELAGLVAALLIHSTAICREENEAGSSSCLTDER